MVGTGIEIATAAVSSLIAGCLSILTAVVFAFMGKASLDSMVGWTAPGIRWQVSLYFLGGIGLIVLYLAN